MAVEVEMQELLSLKAAAWQRAPSHQFRTPRRRSPTLPAFNRNVWSVVSVDIRTSLDRDPVMVARVELHHAARGRVAEVALADGAIEAVLEPTSLILGVEARIKTLALNYSYAANGGSTPEVTAKVSAQVSNKICGAWRFA